MTLDDKEKGKRVQTQARAESDDESLQLRKRELRATTSPSSTRIAPGLIP